MQRIVDFGLGIKQYVDLVRERGVRGLRILEGVLACPFCEDGHPMRLHGDYERFAADRDWTELTRIRRLLCARTGQTVSLLPLCLAPGKQHTWVVIGSYLGGRLIWGLSPREAMENATRVNPSRQKGEYWERCLIDGRAKGEAYLGSGRRESSSGGPMASYIRHLKRGFKSLGDALAFHNRRIRERLGVWLL